LNLAPETLSYAELLSLGAHDDVIQSSLKHAMALEDMGSLQGAARLCTLSIKRALYTKKRAPYILERALNMSKRALFIVGKALEHI